MVLAIGPECSESDNHSSDRDAFVVLAASSNTIGEVYPASQDV